MKYEALYHEGLKRLRAAGVEEAESDTFLLFSEAFGLSRSTYFFKKQEEIPSAEVDRIERFFDWLTRREAHEPVQYILGNQAFYGMLFDVDPRVLIPRMDTEVLVDEVVHHAPAQGRMLDLCTGSGCILIACLANSGLACGVGTDLSEDALAVARANVLQHEVKATLLQGDLWEALEALPEAERRFDVITSNPPYIAEWERPELAPEVVDREPNMALFADHDGLAFYERIAEKINTYLVPGGQLYLEIGCRQGEAVKTLLEQAGLERVRVIQDLAGLDRVVTGERKKDV